MATSSFRRLTGIHVVERHAADLDFHIAHQPPPGYDRTIMNNLPLKHLCLLPLFLLSFGCSALNFQKPSATIKGMQLQNVTAQGFTMNFDVDVNNPNAVELPLTAGDYKIGVYGSQIVEGKVKPEGAVPSHGSRSVNVPVNLTFENLLAVGSGLTKSGGDIPFDFDGGLSFGSGGGLLGDMRVPLRYSGTMHLKTILSDAAILLKSPSARALAEKVLGKLLNF